MECDKVPPNKQGAEMDEMIAFFRARLNEEEFAAYQSADFGGGIVSAVWRLSGSHGIYWSVAAVAQAEGHEETIDVVDAHTEQVANHIVLHDPHRVLRSIKAKRRMLDAFAAVSHGERTAPHEDMRDVSRAGVDTWRFVLRLSVAEYADHPDYKTEWRP